MGAPTLDDCRVRLNWAYRHLQVLEAELAAAPNYADAIFFAQAFDPDRSTIEVTLQGVPELPAKWGLIAADFLHSVRAALNYLVWELSRWNLLRLGKDREPHGTTQFPIFYRRPGGWSDGRLPDLHADHVAVIRESQPSEIEFEVSSRYLDLPKELGLPGSVTVEWDRAIAAHPLTHLAKLTNADKHRTLPVALLGSWEGLIQNISGRNCVLGERSWGAGMAYLENGAEWGAVKVIPSGEGQPEVEMHDKITRADPCVGDCRIADLPAIGACAEAIIARFEPVFSE